MICDDETVVDEDVGINDDDSCGAILRVGMTVVLMAHDAHASSARVISAVLMCDFSSTSWDSLCLRIWCPALNSGLYALSSKQYTRRTRVELFGASEEDETSPCQKLFSCRASVEEPWGSNN